MEKKPRILLFKFVSMRQLSIRSLVKYLIVGGLLVFLGACRSPSEVKQMLLSSYSPETGLSKFDAVVAIEVDVQVRGTLGSTRKEGFRQAISEELAKLFMKPVFKAGVGEQFIIRNQVQINVFVGAEDQISSVTVLNALTGETLCNRSRKWKILDIKDVFRTEKIEYKNVMSQLMECVIEVFSDQERRQREKQIMTVQAPASRKSSQPFGSATSGLYRLDNEVTFNVLDYAVMDPTKGHIMLMGHRDEKYGVNKIPYLQHLAVLLDHPRPEFSFIWTRESEARVDAILRRMDSMEEMRKIVAEWGKWVDENDRVTVAGRHFLPLFGVQLKESSWERVDRAGIVASILQAAGNHKGASVVEKYTTMTRILKSGTTQEKQSALLELLTVIDKLEVLSRIQEQVRRGEITQAQARDPLMRSIPEGMDYVFGLSGRPVVGAYDQARRRGASPEDAFDVAIGEMNRQLRTVMVNAMQDLMNRYEEVQVPPEVIYNTLGVRPEVIPEYRGIDSHSQLARVLFDSDYLAKSLINKPELKQKIPQYQTEFAFERNNPSKSKSSGVTSSHHLWISIERLDLAQSPDGNILSIRDAKMRFNIREKSRDGLDRPVTQGSYEELLTSLYDDFAVIFPVLHELREAAKLAAVAQWLKALKPNTSLSKVGLTTWNSPAKAPGLVYLTWSPKPPRGGAPAMAVKAMGGVSLVVPLTGLRAPSELVPAGIPVDSSVVDLRQSTTFRGPQSYGKGVLDAALGASAGVPAPQPLGWVSEELKGRIPLQGVCILLKEGHQDVSSGVSLHRSLAGDITVLWNTTDLETTQNMLRAAIKRPGTDPREVAVLHMMLGQVLHQMGNDARAVKEVQEGIKLAPDIPFIHLLHATTLFEKGNLKEAQEALKQYVALEPKDTAVVNVLRNLQAFPPGGLGPSAMVGMSRPLSVGERVTLRNAWEQLNFLKGREIELFRQEMMMRKKDAGIGLDDQPDKRTSPSPVIVPSIPREIPVGLANRPREREQWIKLQQREKELVQTYRELVGELNEVRTKKDRNEENKAQLELTESNIERRLSETTGEIKKVRIEMIDLSIKFEEKTEQGASAPTGISVNPKEEKR